MNKKKTIKAWMILNVYGEWWSLKVFNTRREAEEYKILFWGGVKEIPDMSQHEVVEVGFSLPSPKKRKK